MTSMVLTIPSCYPKKTLQYPLKPPRRLSLKNSSSDSSIIGDGIPSEDVKLLAKFKSRHNYIRVLQVSRRADHQLAGTRLLLLDRPGNIHSIASLHPGASILTGTYFDVIATFPATLPAGPVALLGLGAASAVGPILRLHPSAQIHAWELDPAVVSVAREYFGLKKLEAEFPGRLVVHIGDAFRGISTGVKVKGGFAGIIVDLFSRGSLLPQLQEVETWKSLARCLRKDGRVMANVGGSCVESEEAERDGQAIMGLTLEAMARAFGDDKLFVLTLGDKTDDSTLALTGDSPNRDYWKTKLPKSFRGYVDMWSPYTP